MTQEAFGIVLGAIVVIVVTLGAFVGLVYLACLAALRHHARETAAGRPDPARPRFPYQDTPEP